MSNEVGLNISLDSFDNNNAFLRNEALISFLNTLSSSYELK